MVFNRTIYDDIDARRVSSYLQNSAGKNQISESRHQSNCLRFVYIADLHRRNDDCGDRIDSPAPGRILIDDDDDTVDELPNEEELEREKEWIIEYCRSKPCRQLLPRYSRRNNDVHSLRKVYTIVAHDDDDDGTRNYYEPLTGLG